jgi:hypothetical protein
MYIVMCISDCRRGFDWWIDLLTTQVVTTNNYNAIADIHIHYKSLHSLLHSS